MTKRKNKKKSILSIIVCTSVATPIVCFPLGMRDDENAAFLVRRAYAAALEDEDMPEEEYPPEENVDIDMDDEQLQYLMNGGLIQATYDEGYDPGPTDTEYTDVGAYTVYQVMDESGLPVELLDPMYFASDDSDLYINAQNSILKESPDMDSLTLSTIRYGMMVRRIVIGDTWSKIRIGSDEEGYIEGYVLSSTLQVEMVWSAVDHPIWVDTGGLSLRAEPSVESEIIRTLPKDTRVRRVGIADKWSKVICEDGTEGYVYSSYVTTSSPTPTNTPIPPRPRPSSGGGGGSSSGGGGGTNYNNYSQPLITGCNVESVVSAAESMLGKPYVWGACSSSAVDCSGLVTYCYSLVGISIPHSSYSQCTVGQAVDRSNIRAGDIVCWDTGGGSCGHVGLYVGGGQCIEARGARWGVVYCSVDKHPILTIRRVIG